MVDGTVWLGPPGARVDYHGSMVIRPCPQCRKPVPWELTPTRPFCSERCRTLDLGAWSSEAYVVPEDPALEDGEGWSGAGSPPED